jgi:hypothetical protein
MGVACGSSSDEREHPKAQWKEAVSSTRMFRSQYRLRSGDENDQGISLLCVPLLKDAEELDVNLGIPWLMAALDTGGEVEGKTRAHLLTYG